MGNDIKKGNTLASLLAEYARRESNAIEILEKYTELYTSVDDKVIIEWVDENDETHTLELPSFGYVLSEMRRLSQNQESMSGLGTKSATLILPDGQKKIIISSELPSEPEPIKQLEKPEFFKKKNNRANEALIDPLTYISINLTGKIKDNTDRVFMKRFVLDINNTTKLDYFNNNINDSNTPHDQLLQDLVEQDISYKAYEELVIMPPKDPKYTGEFDVLDIKTKDINKIVNNTEVPVKRTVYKLNKHTYNDVANEMAEISLKVGDEMIVAVDENRNTVYEIDTIDTSTNEVSFVKKEGYQIITIGVGTLIINSKFDEKLLVDANISKDEYSVFFFKPLNPNMNVINIDWGDGIGLYSNELIDFDSPENNVTLFDFFESSVQDISNSIKLLTSEGLTPSSKALIPNAPVLNEDDFSVDYINSHKENVGSTQSLRKKYAEKEEIKSRMTNLDTEINNKKDEISNANYKNSNEKNTKEKELETLQTQKESETKKYASLVTDIMSRVKETQSFSKKYRVRGFTDIPESKYTDEANKTGEQGVIALETQYRYLKKDNSSTEGATKQYTNAEGKNSDAVFSKWIPMPIPKIREKTVDDNGNTIWANENPNDPDALNINQVEIPVSYGENVEFRMRSISEAGWPYTKVYSEWSESIIKEFPDELIDDTDPIIEETQNENVLVQLQQELIAQGLPSHISDSFISGDTTFKHHVNNIATDELTPENKPKSNGQVIKEMKTEIAQLTALITGEKGEISVAVTDDVGNEIQKVNDNDTVNVFAGYYKDTVETATIKKGEIVTKLYYIEISNINDADLELLSFVPGLYEEKTPDENYDGYLYNSEEYVNYRKYWQSPLSLRAVVDNNEFREKKAIGNPFIELPAFQSSQSKGQLLYSRHRDLTLNDKLYLASDEANDINGNIKLPILSGSNNEPFIWNGTQNTDTVPGNGAYTDFCVHIDHPDLADDSEYMLDWLNYDPATTVPRQTINISTSKPYYPLFIHNKYFNLESFESEGLKQLGYREYDSVSSNANINNFTRKIGFRANDKYLIGKDTVGSYLFLAPDVHKSIYVDSIIYNEGLIVKKGDENIVRIPVLYQARMTDYFGTGDSGIGKIGGVDNKQNLSYEKKIGFDVVIKNQSLFSFDMKVGMKYKKDSIGQ